MNLNELNDISFITFTNIGYLHYTKNLILSLEKCNFSFCLSFSYNYLIFKVFAKGCVFRMNGTYT